MRVGMARYVLRYLASYTLKYDYKTLWNSHYLFRGVILHWKLLSTLESISLSVLHLEEKCTGSPTQYHNIYEYSFYHFFHTWSPLIKL